MPEHVLLSADEIKAELLAMLVKFDAFCTREGLSYSLAGGTLLGAVRHQGFIPWDDDIDLTMPRPDYEKLLDFGKSSCLPEGFFAEPYSSNWENPIFIKIYSEDIAVDMRFEKDICRLWLDIIPVDGLPNDDAELSRIYSSAKSFRDVIALCKADTKQGKTGFKRLLKPIAVPVVNALGMLPRAARQLESLAVQLDFGETPWVGAVTWGLYGPGERYPISGWGEMTRLEFEGQEFPAIGCWDEYLHGIYGDYMRLPHEDKRVTHELKAWRITEEG